MKYMEAKELEIDKELLEVHIFPVSNPVSCHGKSQPGAWWRKCNGQAKKRPIWDYSRPMDVGVSATIELENDKIVDGESGLGLGLQFGCGSKSQFCLAQSFKFGGVHHMHQRRKHLYAAHPAILAWMQAQGVPCVGYLNDFFMVATTQEEAEELMMLLVGLLSYPKASSHPRGSSGLGEDRVVLTAKELHDQMLRAPVRKQQLESLWGLLAFCSQVVWGPLAFCSQVVWGWHFAARWWGLLAFCSQVVWGLLAFCSQVVWSLLAFCSQVVWSLLASCSQVVWGLFLYTCRFFSRLAASTTLAALRVTLQVLEDLATFKEGIHRYNSRKVVLYWENVKMCFSANGSVGTKGMSGLMDERFFAHS
ncbi:hypothetical protein CYMTET_38717 [Cymbomonas tetramitiformis]|uniref:Uncharacterized protein n=1 Tax=Cymbomonas tetramitiformis TaxID=36881 RepID=A0AAE0F5D6_9CHLO|nr:hypothetical protein CYMTET_38717 [Cymbomonas tetramitiformis]